MSAELRDDKVQCIKINDTNDTNALSGILFLCTRMSQLLNNVHVAPPCGPLKLLTFCPNHCLDICGKTLG